ncbi:hypothetical protein VTJ49DRAFT_7559 [Mycothermus thermophilus]|uniref:Uncharacterized protein n=1 Tax=Humicola insolens TaxID=85995 RepID=A0ABR3VGM7_HUMIN
MAHPPHRNPVGKSGVDLGVGGDGLVKKVATTGSQQEEPSPDKNLLTAMTDEKSQSSDSPPKGEVQHAETHVVAEKGHAATDDHGNALVQFDPKAEAKLRRKIDLCIVPTVSLLYLFCFIDRANIGKCLTPLS